MGSRIMHLIIANQITKNIKIGNKKEFLLGGIAPDSVSNKEISHFFVGDINNYTRSINYEGFLNKYRSFKHKDFVLGYYTHLIADDIWLKGFYLPWLKNRLENDEKMLNLYHNDFRLLNGQLLNFYGINQGIYEEMVDIEIEQDLEEVKTSDLKEFVPVVLEDMNYEQETLNEKLNVFTFQQMIGYMETSIEKGILLLNILNKYS